MKAVLPDYLIKEYRALKPKIRARLKEFREVSPDDYFYELCFCLCTPQSKAANALIVQSELMARNFREKPFDITSLLSRPENYIRFHNTKSLNIHNALKIFPEVMKILDCNWKPIDKRNSICNLVRGIGMKESSHFLRNIGYPNLAILDRHILKNLVKCGLFESVPNISSVKNYLQVESAFAAFSKDCKISIDELDLLFWSNEAGEIIK
jgi:N-glycosylase/DNA lyase